MKRKIQATPEDTQEMLFASVEEAKVMASALTGVRQAFIDAGWSPEGAEQIVIALVNR